MGRALDRTAFVLLSITGSVCLSGPMIITLCKVILLQVITLKRSSRDDCVVSRLELCSKRRASLKGTCSTLGTYSYHLTRTTSGDIL